MEAVRLTGQKVVISFVYEATEESVFDCMLRVRAGEPRVPSRDLVDARTGVPPSSDDNANNNAVTVTENVAYHGWRGRSGELTGSRRNRPPRSHLNAEQRRASHVWRPAILIARAFEIRALP